MKHEKYEIVDQFPLGAGCAPGGDTTRDHGVFALSDIPVVMAAAVFALIHGALRYRWSGILAFLVVCLVVSNILENTSILTGFPFGHYHYTSGPMLFLVPWFIGPSYFATAYLAWMDGVVLIGDVRREVSWFTTVAVPVIGSAVMVMWDLTFDPTASTIKHFWIWEQGGGYFGVPLTNYVGWFFTVYVFLQLFALFLRFRRVGADSLPLPASYYAQAVASYAVIGVAAVLSYLVFTGNTVVTDAAGVVWQTRSITEAEAAVSIFTMIFVSVLSGVKMLQASADLRHASTAARTGIAA